MYNSVVESSPVEGVVASSILAIPASLARRSRLLKVRKHGSQPWNARFKSGRDHQFKELEVHTLWDQIRKDAAASAAQPAHVRAAVQWALNRLRDMPREEREPEAPLFYPL